jgi:transcriptional regulator with XRE-family HTH domain
MFEIGSALREARERRGLSYGQVEAETAIRTRYIRALEEEDFHILPGPTYTKGFLRAYAEYLGLDGQPFVDEYNSRFAVSEDDTPLRARRTPAPRRRDRRSNESRIAVLALLAIAVATALVIAAWKFGGPDAQTVPGLATQPASTSPAASTGRVRLVVRAVDGNSWMEVRTAAGGTKLLYSGTLEKGQRKAFQGQALELSLARPRNVAVRVNGTAVDLPAGTTFRVTKRQLVSATS